MKLRTCFSGLLFSTAAFATFCSCARAGTILYTLSGIGTGTLGNQSFFQQQFTITAGADTSQIVNHGPPPGYIGDLFDVFNMYGANVTISGLGTATFTDPTSTFAYQSDAVWGITGINQSGDQEDILELAVGSPGNFYDLSTAIGPVHAIAAANGGIGSGPFLTTAGPFHLTSWSTGIFQATLVPEPSAPAVTGLCAGIALLHSRKWRPVLPHSRRVR